MPRFALGAAVAALALTGCRAPGTPASSAATALTFNKDIAPIIWQHCAGCHRPGQIGPFSLLTYQDVRPRGRTIVSVTADHVMPPWSPEPGYGEFVNARRLRSEQIEELAQWVAAGAPEGDPADRRPPPAFVESWQLGQPDLVLQLPEPYAVQPGPEDVFRNFVLPIPTSSTQYVRGLEVRPGNNAIVHHVTIGVDRTRVSRQLDAADPEPGFAGGMFSEGTNSPGNHALGWTPGMTPTLEPPDMAWRLDAGADLVLQMHLLPSRTGKTETVRPSVGLFFSRTPPTRGSIDFKLGSKAIDIPAGVSNYVAEDAYTLPVGVDVVSIYPHAHYLAREMKVFATLPGGAVQWLIWIKDWDFHWQDQYRYVRPVSLPRGAVITMRYTYDNAATNEHNPNKPPKRVRYGPQSSDEMGDLWLRFLPRTVEDAAVLARSYAENELRKDITGAEQRVARNPRDAKEQDFLGAKYVQAGRVPEGIAHLSRAVALDPRDADAHNNLAEAFRAQGRFAEAIAHLREAVRLVPTNDLLRLNLADALSDAGDLDAAIAAFRAAIALNPHVAEAHNNLGAALASRGRLDEAAAEFGRALEIRPDYLDAQRNVRQVRQLQRGRGAPR